MNTSRLVLGIFGVGIAVVFAIDSTGYPDQAAQMPLIYSMAVALLSLGMVAECRISKVCTRISLIFGINGSSVIKSIPV